MDGTDGFRLAGIDADDYSGVSVSNAGDVNGDGFDDVIIGAFKAGETEYAGESYVVFGKSGGFDSSIPLSSLDGTNGFRLDGTDSYDYSGFPVSSAGDVNGDGFDDLLIGASESDPGKTFVVFGASQFNASIALNSLNGTNGLQINAINDGDLAGISISTAGDVNGDGFDDVIIGAHRADPGGRDSAGESYVIFGTPFGFTSVIELSSLDGTNGFRLSGIAEDDNSGRAVSDAGDVNGDGYDDVIVGAYRANGGAGETYIVFGKPNGFSSIVELSSLNGTSGFRLSGIDENDNAGRSVSSAGDVNGDGFADVIIGARRANNNVGESYVVFGKSGGFAPSLGLAELTGTTGFRIDGVAAGDNLGNSVSGAGDVNGDGFDDLVIGAYGADPSGQSSAGQTFVLFGKESGFSPVVFVEILDPESGFRLDGIDERDYSGGAVSNAGDVNGDGFDDLIIAAYGANDAAGESYVFFGGNFTGGAETKVGDGTANTLNADQGAGAIDILIGAQGNDTLNGDGGADVLLGGEGHDVLNIADLNFQKVAGGSGGDTLNVNNLDLNLLTVGEGRLTGIEQINLLGNSTLTLTALEVLNLSDTSNTLVVIGDSNTTVDRGSGWAFAGFITASTLNFRAFQQGAATLFIADQVATARVDSVSLNQLNGLNGFQLNGIDGGDLSGRSVSSAGDVNGDGFDDLIIGAYLAEPGGSSGAGESYVVFGKSGGFAAAIDLSSLDGSSGFRLDGIDEYDSSGRSVSNAGDLNGDGFDDLIIGAHGANRGGNSNAGESYVVFGKSGGFASAINLATLDGTTGFRLDGIDVRDYSGISVSSAGDVNGDGFNDLIIGAFLADSDGNLNAGESYVVFGKSGGFVSAINLATLDGTTGFRLDGIDEGDRSGISVSSAGDVNGDGFDDLIIGARGANPGGNSNAGESYVVFGKSGGFASAINLATLDGTTGFRLDGIDEGDYSGNSVSSAGDVNGDGFDDLIIGALYANPKANAFAGESYVVFGTSGGFASAIELSSLDGTTGFRLDGVNEGDRSGSSVSSAGDVNGDGFDDLIIGAYRADPGGNLNAGESYVVFGKSGGFASVIDLATLNGSTGFRLDGIISDDRSGNSVSSAGDVNGDGFDDLIIGADFADPGGNSRAGESYVFFGGNFTGGAETKVGDEFANTLNANQGSGAIDILIGAQGDDTLNGDGGADVLLGGEGDDVLNIADLNFQRVAGGNGFDRLGVNAQTLDLSLIPDNQLTGIEQIDLTGSSTLTLTALEVLNLSDTSNTLIVTGNSMATVNRGSGWTFTAFETIDGEDFKVFQQGAATLKIGNFIATEAFSFSVLPLDKLGNQGFVINGIDTGDGSGRSVSSAGDVNGDGFDDLIISASSADSGGSSYAGESYVVFGKSGGFASAINLATLDGTTGFRLDGIDERDFSGNSVSSAGDLNGDGFDDLVIGAFFADPNGNSQAGESYVVFGKSGGFVSAINLAMLDGTTGFRLDGIDGSDYSGISVSSAGDVNGDGFDDLIIGASFADSDGNSSAGESYVVFGKSGGFASAINLATLDGTTGFRLDGVNEGDRSGNSVSSAGDLNGDGFDDLVIGAFFAGPNGNSEAGESYVVFGKSSGFASAINLATLDGNTGFRLDGIDAGDRSGGSVSSAGDVNGDGFDDLIISASSADSGGSSYAGESYVVFGKSGGFASAINLATLDGNTGFRLDGIDEDDLSGRSVSRAGDVNGDGFDDLIIGAYGANPGGNLNAGESYVVFGKSGGFASAINLATLDGTTGFRLDGIDEDDYSGISVSSAGDVNGDGFDDLIIGADFADPGGNSRAGESYVFFGGNFTGGAETQVGDGTANTVNADQGAGAIDILIGAQGDDTLNGDGGADVLLGGEGDDVLNIADLNFQRVAGGNGFDRLGVNAQTLDLSLIPDNQLTGIEQLDLTGGSTLTLTALEVLNLSDTSNTLIVTGNSMATVNRGSGWILTGFETIGSEVFKVFQQNAATLKVGDFIATETFSFRTLPLSPLGSQGFVINGTAANDYSGRSVSSAGDVNGDGFDDLIIGAFRDDPDGNISAGESYVVFGKSGGFTAAIDLATLNGTTGFRLDGVDAGDEAGASVSSAGDVNGDGFSDLIIGARSADSSGNNYTGASYVVFGKSGGFASAIDLSSLDGNSGFRLEGIDNGDNTGRSVSGAGDVNGDGFDDLIIGAYNADPDGNSSAGESYVVFGKSGGFVSAIDLSTLDGTTGFRLDGVDGNDFSGFSVSTAGDVNGDGYDDLIIGAFGAFSGENSSAGESYVVFGKSGGFAAAIDLATLDGNTGFRLDGIDEDDKSGSSVSSAGDVNGDGFDDLIIGAYAADPGGSNRAGESYVVFGKSGGFAATIDLSSLDGVTGFRLDGVDGIDLSGFSVSSAGDVNGDGFDDLIIGAPYAIANGIGRSGTSYVVFGKSGGFAAQIDLATLGGNSGFRLDGIDNVDNTGRSVSGAGDVNGDGFDDLIIGAFLADPNGNIDAGETYVFFGGNFTGGAETKVGDEFANTLNADQGSGAIDILIGAQGNDTLNGDGGADVLLGGEGDDVLNIADTQFQRVAGGNGFDRLGVNAQTLDLSSIPDNQLTGIEQIDLTGNSTLTLTVLEVLNVSGTSNTLIVTGDSMATVNRGSGWILTGFETIGSEVFKVFQQNAATLKVGDFIATEAFSFRTLPLSPLGNQGFVINGIAAGDFSGTSVSSAGDVNGDGFDDLLIGARYADPGGRSSAGESYVVFGQAGGFGSAIELASLDGTTGFRLEGIDAGDETGISVSSAGDVNGDSFDDLIIGAHRADPGGRDSAGASYVVFGKAAGFSSAINLDTLDGTTGFRLDGVDARDRAGRSVSNAGDVNGDGFNDLIVGAYFADPDGKNSAGESYVVFGKSGGFASAIDLASLNGTTGFRLNGVDQFDTAGRSVSSAGDVNGDGFADLIIGAYGADSDGISSGEGESYVVFGKSGGFTSAIDLSSLDGVTGFRLDGVDADDRSGSSVSSAGDVNGDGFGDVIVGALVADPNGESAAGESYVVFGKAGGFASAVDLGTLDGTTGFRLEGSNAGDLSGVEVSSAGDVNGDGYDDLIIGANRADPDGRDSAGASYLLFGKPGEFNSTIDLDSLDGTTGFRLDGIISDDRSGNSVSSAGDVNGDGFGDLIIGASSADSDELANIGQSYVFFGGNFTGGAETKVGDEFANTLNANQGSGAIDILIGAQGNDTLNGDGGADVLLGGEGDDVLNIADLNFQRVAGGNGFDRLGVNAQTLDLSSIPDNQLTGIEQIDLTGSSTLTLTALEVLNLSDTSNTLIVTGNSMATVNRGSGWTFTAFETIDGEDFKVFQQDAATLKIGNFIATEAFSFSVLPLNKLGNQGFVINGIDTGDGSGRSVSSAGDVNGDGFDDLIISASSADSGGSSYAGESYVVFGKSGGFASAINLATLDGTTGFRLDGIDERDFSGNSVSSAGDLNGDGFDDLVIGAFFADPNGNSQAGESYVVFGKSGGFVSAINLAMLDGTTGFRLDGIDGSDYSGISVSSAGDVNGDGFDDLIIGASFADSDGNSSAGESYVVFGKSGGFASAINLATLDGTTGFRLDGVDGGDYSGGSVSSAGDVNGDGFNDLIIGASSADSGGNSSAGESYVVFGKSGGFASAINLATLDGNTGFRLDGIDAGDRSGGSVSSAGDVNGDGFDDLIISASSADSGGSSYAGESYVVFGKSGGFASAINLATLDGTTGFRLDGIDERDFSGNSVSSAGDLNGDGFDDLIIGAHFADPNGNRQAGESYVVFGKSGGFVSAINLATIDGTTGFRLDGFDGSDYSGISVSRAGDVNGDGFDDLIIGAPNASPNGNNNAGESYVFFGGNFTGGAETKVGDGTANTVNADQGAGAIDILIGAQGDDTLNGDGGADVLLGGEGDDVLNIADIQFQRVAGGNGFDRLGVNAQTLDLSLISDNQLTGIEQIDLTGGSTLKLTVLEVLNLSDTSNTLIVTGDNTNRIDLDDFRLATESVESHSGLTFNVYTIGAAQLKVATTIQQFISLTGGDFELLSLDGDTVIRNSVDRTELFRRPTDGLQSLAIEGSPVDDNLTVLFAGENPIPRQGVTFAGGAGTDTVTFSGQLATGAFQSILYSNTGSNTGMVDFDFGTTAVISGVESVVDTTPSSHRIFGTAPAFTDNSRFTVENDATVIGRSVFTSDAGLATGGVSFRSPTSRLTIIGGNGNETITVSPLDFTFSASLSIDGGAGNDFIDASGVSTSITILGSAGNDTITGTDFADLLEGGSGDDVLVALDGDDRIRGGVGNDFLIGDGGDDELNGGDGDDTLSGGFGDDVLQGGNGADAMAGGSGNDVMTGDAGNDVLGGNSGEDILFGGEGDDTLDGGTGNDTVEGENGADSMKGGAGNDELYGGDDAGNDSIDGGTGEDLLDGGDGDDFLVGGDGHDTIIGADGNDTGLGSGGNDRITGGAGMDSLVGQDGDDTVDGQTGDDVVLGGPGNDLLFGREGNDFLESEGGDDDFFGGPGDDIINGGADNDRLFGEDGNDTLNGESGNDQLDGGDGDDSIVGGAGVDTLRIIGEGGLSITASTSSGSGNDNHSEIEQAILESGDGNHRLDASAAGIPVTLVGGAGNDTLLGGGSLTDFLDGGDGIDFLEINGSNIILTNDSAMQAAGSNPALVERILLIASEYGSSIDASAYTLGPVTIIGSAGPDTLKGTPGDDIIIAGSGNDDVDGGPGHDFIQGNSGSDTINGAAGNDTVYGGAGRDILDGGAGSDKLLGGGHADTIRGGDGDDVLLGGAGLDTIDGDDGADRLAGGSGRDNLAGGLGNDTLNGTFRDDAFNQVVGLDTLIGGQRPAPRPAPVIPLEKKSAPESPQFIRLPLPTTNDQSDTDRLGEDSLTRTDEVFAGSIELELLGL